VTSGDVRNIWDIANAADKEGCISDIVVEGAGGLGRKEAVVTDSSHQAADIFVFCVVM
jgi:hypothetical protein